MNLEDVKKLNIPLSPGCYQFFNSKGEIIYIGKAASLKSRVLSYWQKSANHSPAKYSMLKQIEQIKVIETESEIEALLLESNLVKKFQPPYNIALRDDKRFIYVKVTLEDEIPSIFITRKVDKSGRYFGPFVSVQAVRETLKIIRKIWPYCAMRKYQSKPCFHYQINLCTGICAHKIERKEYLEKVIKPIILFFEGKKKKIVADYEKELKASQKALKKFSEESIEYSEIERSINSLKSKLFNIHRVLEHANVIGVGEKYANDVVELAKVLGLTKIPERIEGYDIANIFGREAVGSMVVFSGGEANKNEYRKFKIKIGEGEANDIRMLKEVLERRLKHISPCKSPLPPLNKGGQDKKAPPMLHRRGKGESDFWPLPDLIIIDGGKGQLNAVSAVLKKNKLNIPVIAISKGSASEIPWLKPGVAKPISRARGLRSSLAPDKLYFPGESKPLELPLASPALHIIKRVRDEAHRFAISYHRKLRGKKFFK